jgi:DNA-binding NarL/FixJ family response regulator/tetratricopeptide (TPR) repeat protein
VPLRRLERIATHSYNRVVGDAAAPPVGQVTDIVGRDAEQDRIDAFVAMLADGPRALVIRGEPGIGKTTLWRYAVDRCRRAGARVLLTRPAEDEMPLALGGLVDLFEQLSLDEAALHLDDDPMARGRAVLDGLRGLADAGPVVIAVDDLQWLDSASARALRYALRRLEEEPVGVVAAARLAEEAEDPLALPTTLPGRHEELVLGPLGQGALRVVLTGFVASITRPALRRIHAVSGGNPLYAIELVRARGTDDRSLAAGGVRLPESLQAAIRRRIETVPTELVPLLETASALGPTSVPELRETLAGVDADGLLAVAGRHELLVVEENLEVRFAHPLVGSAVYARMSPLARRSLHGRLAAHAADPDVRARHLALSSDDPDGDVAELLERAAERASGRGAADLAAEFASHSARLTPPGADEDARRRALAEITHRAAAGEASRALALAGRLVDSLPPGPGRAEAQVRRAYLWDDDAGTQEAFLLGALGDAVEDALLRGRVLDQLGWLRVSSGDLRGSIECAEEALAIADRVGDRELQMHAAAALGDHEAIAGRHRPDLMARAVLLEQELGTPALWIGPRALLGKQLLWAGELVAARTQLSSVHADVVRSGNELRRPYHLFDLGLVECAAGRLDAAEELVRRAMEAARDAEDSYGARLLLYPLGLVEAWRGRSEEARATAGLLLEGATRRGALPSIARARRVLGLVALSEGDAATAAAELAEAAALLETMGFAHPGAPPVLPDAVEALAASGAVEPARALLARLERQAAAVGSAWASAEAERCRGVLLLAEGDAETAAAMLEASAASLRRLDHEPSAARAVLAQGRALLRAGRRTAAAEALADARDRFAAMGASLWEARAAEELERAAPGRASGELTRAERSVVTLVAQGKRNREVAQALYMSVATVEAHLTRIYRKLEIHSRSELARLVADGTIVVSD